MEKASKAQSEEDEAEHFGKLVTSKLRRLPPDAVDEAMSRIYPWILIVLRDVKSEFQC